MCVCYFIILLYLRIKRLDNTTNPNSCARRSRALCLSCIPFIDPPAGRLFSGTSRERPLMAGKDWLSGTSWLLWVPKGSRSGQSPSRKVRHVCLILRVWNQHRVADLFQSARLGHSRPFLYGSVMG